MAISFVENVTALGPTNGGKIMNIRVILRGANWMEKELSSSKEKFTQEFGRMALRSRLMK